MRCLTICSQQPIHSIFTWKTHPNFFFGWQFCFFVSFWITFGSRKLFCGLTSEKCFFLSNIWIVYNLQKLLLTTYAFWLLKKSKNGCKSIFHHHDKKNNKTFCQKKVFVCWPFWTNQKLFVCCKMLYFLSHSWKMFLII